MVSTSTGSDPRRRDSRLSVSARRLNRCHAEDAPDEDPPPPLLQPAGPPPMMAAESSDRMGLKISAPPEDRRRMAFFALRRFMPKLFRMITLLVLTELSQGTDPRRCMLYAGPMLFGRVVATTTSGFWLAPPFGWSFVCIVMNSAGMEPRRRSHDLMTNDTLSSGSAAGLGGRATVTGADPRRRLRLRFSIDGSRFSFWPPPVPPLPSRPRESFGILALSALSADADESCESRLVAASFLMDTRMPRDSLSASGALLEELLLLLDSRSASGQAPSSAWEDMYRVRMYGCNGGKVC